MPKKLSNKRDPVSHRSPAQEKRRLHTHHNKPAQIRKRAEQVKANRIMEKAGKSRKGDGKDVDHKVPLSKGGKTVKSNLRLKSPKANRGHGMSKGKKKT